MFDEKRLSHRLFSCLFLRCCYAGGPPLDDSFWHVTEYYENIRNKVRNIDPDAGECSKFSNINIPSRVCHTIMKVRGRSPKVQFQDPQCVVTFEAHVSSCHRDVVCIRPGSSRKSRVF